MHAVAFGMTDTVRGLVDAGADVNAVNINGNTAFTAAAGLDARADAIAMTQLLLSRGSADLEVALPSVVSAPGSSCCSPESLSAVVDILESQWLFQSQSQEKRE
jgi:ankyrin repeat protein